MRLMLVISFRSAFPDVLSLQEVNRVAELATLQRIRSFLAGLSSCEPSYVGV